MQTGYFAWITSRVSGGRYIIDYDTTQNIFLRIKKSAAWIQSGATIAGPTTLRVCYGSNKVDIGVDITGSITKPSGFWFGGGDEVSTYFSSTVIQPDYPFPGDLGSLGNRINPAPPYNPPVPPESTYTDWINTLNGLANLTTSDPFVVYAYEIESPTPSYQNPPGWTPKWIIKGWDEGLPIGELTVPAPESGDLDQQMVSIFSQKISVSQNDFGFVGKGIFKADNTGNYITGLESGLEGPYNDAKNLEIIITIDPMNYVDGYPVMNGNPFPGTNYNATTGGQEQETEDTNKPPRDGGGNRPIYGYPGGGSTATAPDFISVEVTPDPIAHDNTDIGSFKTKSFTIKNTGTVSVEVDEIVNTHPDNIFTFGMSSPNGIPFTIDPTEEFGGTAYFLPVNAVSYTELGYVKKEGNILRSFSITGTGTSSGNPGETPLRKIALFGDVFSSGDRNFLERTIGTTTLTTIRAINAGNLPITLNNVSLGGAGVFTTPGITSGFSLEVGAELPIDVSFTPVGAQEYLGTFTLNSNAQASDQVGFNPATGAITCNLRGEGTPELVLTRIMSFNIQNDGTFEDVLAGGSASAELDATITNIGNSTLLISQFQVQSPFSLELDVFGTFTVGSFEFYSLDTPLLIEAGQTSQPFTIKFTPPTASNFVDDVVVVSNKTIGPESFEVRGLGLFEVIEEPEEPDGPILPDDEPPPGQEFDPGTVPSSALDGNGAACIPKECEVTYVYEYSSNGQIVT
jgi:hypothetical protein